VAQVGSAVGKPIHKPKIDFYDPFLPLFIRSLWVTACTGKDSAVRGIYLYQNISGCSLAINFLLAHPEKMWHNGEPKFCLSSHIFFISLGQTQEP